MSSVAQLASTESSNPLTKGLLAVSETGCGVHAHRLKSSRPPMTVILRIFMSLLSKTNRSYLCSQQMRTSQPLKMHIHDHAVRGRIKESV